MAISQVFLSEVFLTQYFASRRQNAVRLSMPSEHTEGPRREILCLYGLFRQSLSTSLMMYLKAFFYCFAITIKQLPLPPHTTNCMPRRQTLYYIFYSIAFALAIFTGLLSGFTAVSTPPAPFVIEAFTLSIGLFLFLADFRGWKSLTVHKIGLAANAMIIVYILVITFVIK